MVAHMDYFGEGSSFGESSYFGEGSDFGEEDRREDEELAHGEVDRELREDRSQRQHLLVLPGEGVFL